MICYRSNSPRPIPTSFDIAGGGFSIGIVGCTWRRPVNRMTIARIQSVVADFYGIHADEMVSARRSREVARPRQIAMFLSKELTPKSLPDIGGRFGKRDHTTVLYAIRTIGALIKADGEIAEDVEALRERLAA